MIQLLTASVKVLVLVTFISLHSSDGYKILITTPPVGSHMLGKLTVGEALVKRGHQVYLAVSDRYPKTDSIRRRGITPLLYTAPSDSLQLDSDLGMRLVAEYIFKGVSPREMSKNVSTHLHKECEYMMSDERFLDEVKKLNFDAVIAEPFLLCPCPILLPVYLRKPLISLSLSQGWWERRIPALPSFAGQSGAPITIDNIRKRNMFTKLKYLGGYIMWELVGFVMEGQRNDLIKKYTPQFNSWSDLIRESQLFLSEVDFRLGNKVPVFPNYINVAGMTADKAKPLPEELKKIMAAAENDGAIVVSFGSTGYYMPEETVRKFLNAFARVPQTVLARINVPQGVTLPKNVKILKWLPQNDLLGHPNTRLFITHCGNSGQYEALFHGVPMLGLPWYAEQHSNCERSDDRGYGLTLDILKFTSDQLVEAINEIVNNGKYKGRIGKASREWKDEWKRETPLEKGVYWIEHVIKFGGRHLRPPSMELSFVEFLMMDVMFVVLVMILLIAVILTCLVRKICRRIRGTKPSEKIKTN